MAQNVFTAGRGLNAQDLTRMSDAIAQTYYFPSTAGGAVTVSSGMTVAVSAITVSTVYVNGSVVGTGYAGGTVTLAASDPTNPRIDSIYYDTSGAVDDATGTAVAVTSTTGPVPPTLSSTQIRLADIYVAAGATSISSGDITDRRQVVGSSAIVLAGSSTVATSTTSTSAVDLVTISGLSITTTTPFRVEWNGRKTATNANYVSFGIKVNSTVVVEAGGFGGSGAWASDATNAAEDGVFVFGCAPRSSANYLNGFYGLGSWRTSATAAIVASTNVLLTGATNPMPNATITAIAIRAINNTNNNNAEVTSIRILTGIS